MSDKPGSGPTINYAGFNHPHPLTQISRGPIRCDVCQQQKSNTWRCVACNYDECPDCFPRTQSRPAAAVSPSPAAGNVNELWRLLNVARDSILPDQRGNPSPWSVPSSIGEVYERLRSAEVSVPSSAQSSGFTSSRSTWTGELGNSSNHSSAHFIRLLKEFEQGINGASQGSWDRSGWLTQCDAAAAGGGGSGGGGNANELWRLLNVARDSINPDQRGNPSNWSMPSSLAEVYERLRAAEVSVPSSAQSPTFMGSRATWVTATNDSSNYSSAHFIRVLKEFEQGINGSAQGSWDRSGWLAQCDAAAAGGGGGGGGADIGLLWRLLNEGRDSINPDQRGNPSPWTMPSNIDELFARLRAAEVSVPSSAQSSTFTSSRSQWTTDCDNAANHNAAGFIRQLKAFEVGINGSAQGSWDRSGWISRCDAAAASGGGGGGGGGGSGDAATLWRLLNEARDSILPDQRGSPSPWSMPSSIDECFARLRAAEVSVPSSAQSASFTGSRATWTSDCDNAANRNTAGFIRLLKAFELGINGSSQGSWDRSGWISRCDAAAAGGGGGGPAIDYSSFCHPHPLVQQNLGHDVRCDVCKQSKSNTYRCTACNYDECPQCFPRTRSQAGAAAPSGPDYSSFAHSHPLVRTDHSGTHLCDVCRQPAPTTYYCSACNYDECTSCFPRTRSQAGVAAPAADKGATSAAAGGGGDKGAAAPK